MLFEIVLIERPTKDQQENGELEKLPAGPLYVVARDETAAMKAVMKDRGELDATVNLDRVEALVRPFA